MYLWLPCTNITMNNLILQLLQYQTCSGVAVPSGDPLCQHCLAISIVTLVAGKHFVQYKLTLFMWTPYLFLGVVIGLKGWILLRHHIYAVRQLIWLSKYSSFDAWLCPVIVIKICMPLVEISSQNLATNQNIPCLPPIFLLYSNMPPVLYNEHAISCVIVEITANWWPAAEEPGIRISCSDPLP